MSFGLQNGNVFAGRYRIVRCIASGGMGSVYEVIHLETERRRALKVMLPHIVQDADLRERFKREARVAAHIESKFIADVFDAGIDDATGMPFLVMELLRGEELGQRLKKVGRFAPIEALTYLQQTAQALDKTHRAAIVHRDLKPANLFLVERDDEAPHIKVLDFGVAKIVAEGTTTGGATMTVGTPLYMAPEQFRNGKVLPAADIYALGMIAYTLLVGHAYWSEDLKRGADPIAFALTVVYGPTEAASARAKRRGVSLPPGFDAWFTRVAALDPSQRFPSATIAIAALHELFAPAGSPRPPLPSVGTTSAVMPSIQLPPPSTPMPPSAPPPSSAPMPPSTPMPPSVAPPPFGRSPLPSAGGFLDTPSAAVDVSAAATEVGTSMTRPSLGQRRTSSLAVALALGVGVIFGGVVLIVMVSGGSRSAPAASADLAAPRSPSAASPAREPPVKVEPVATAPLVIPNPTASVAEKPAKPPEPPPSAAPTATAKAAAGPAAKAPSKPATLPIYSRD